MDGQPLSIPIDELMPMKVLTLHNGNKDKVSSQGVHINIHVHIHIHRYI